MAGPTGHYDDTIRKALQDSSLVQNAGIADVWPMPSSGMRMGQQGMPTPDQWVAGEADRLQAIELKKALKRIREGKE